MKIRIENRTVDSETALAIYNAVYTALYNGEIVDYSSYEKADEYISTNESFKSFSRDLATARMDFFASDREVIALLRTYNNLAFQPLPLF